MNWLHIVLVNGRVLKFATDRDVANRVMKSWDQFLVSGLPRTFDLMRSEVGPTGVDQRKLAQVLYPLVAAIVIMPELPKDQLPFEII